MGWFTHRRRPRCRVLWSIGARHTPAEAGLSLTEVMAAVVVFSLGMAGFSSLQVTAVKLNAKAHISTQMSTVAQEQMEGLLSLPFTDKHLQDNIAALGQGTTYCVLYPPEGMRLCTDPTFQTAYPVKKGRKYCTVTTQTPKGTACSDARFPPPTIGYKVQWTVDVNDFGNPDPGAAKLAYIDITVSRKTEGKRQVSTDTQGNTTTHGGKTYNLSFAKSSL